MKQKNKKQKKVEMVFINIVLYPSEKQKPEEYIKLLSSIMGSRVMIPSSNSSDRSVSIRLKSSKAKPIQVLKNKLLKAFLGLSKSYGTAKAEIINEDGHTEKINTNNHPKTEFVDISQNPARDLQTMVENVCSEGFAF